MSETINNPTDYAELSGPERETLAGWIRGALEPAKRPDRRTSYGLKHAFEASTSGFYVTNGQFKGAMIEAGFAPVDPGRSNWRFRVKDRRR